MGQVLAAGPNKLVAFLTKDSSNYTGGIKQIIRTLLFHFLKSLPSSAVLPLLPDVFLIHPNPFLLSYPELFLS